AARAARRALPAVPLDRRALLLGRSRPAPRRHRPRPPVTRQAGPAGPPAWSVRTSPRFLRLRPLEVVREHLVCRLLADLAAVLDRRAVVDAAPDAPVVDVFLEVLDLVEVAVSEARQAGDGEVDLPRSEETGDHATPGRGDARVRARVLRVLRCRRELPSARRIALWRRVSVVVASAD